MADYLTFFDTYKWTFLFYTALILLIYYFRAKFDWPARFIGLYRTKVGLKLMSRLGKHERFFKWFGYIGVVVGFAGMIFIVGMLVKGIYDLLFVPGAAPVVAPVLPGIKIPGMDIQVPLIIGWIALFAVIVIHEFSHGVVARAHKVKVKSSGLMVFGPLGGAFVEPDEKKMEKMPKSVKLSIFAAGPFSNVVTSIFVFLLLSFILSPLLGAFIATDGVLFSSVPAGFPAQAAGVQADVVYDTLNGEEIDTVGDFLVGLNELKPGETVTLVSTDSRLKHTITAGENPADSTRGYLGVILGTNFKNPNLVGLYGLVAWVTKLFTWIFLLGLGIGLANLLPIGPVDGGRMFQTASIHFFGKQRGTLIWGRASIVLIVILVILLLVPIIRIFF